MNKFRFSRGAESDLLNIGAHTLQNWGESQAARYLNELEAFCRRLAQNPELGRRCDYIRPGLRRLEVRSHVIFYRKERSGVLVLRILHRSMLPDRHLGHNQDD